MPEEIKNSTEQKNNVINEDEEQQNRASILNQNRLPSLQKKFDKSKMVASLINSTPEPIPFLTFLILLTLALINDIGDWFGLDVILFRGSDTIIGGILFFYTFLKGYNKKTIKIEWWFLTFLVELIPILGDIITSWTIFIIYVYRKAKKDYELIQNLINAQNQENQMQTQQINIENNIDYESNLEELSETI